MAYRTPAELARDLSRDPLAATARLLVEAGQATPEELLKRYDEAGWQVRKVAEEVLREPKLADAAEVVAPLAPRRPVRVARVVADAGTAVGGRSEAFGGRLPLVGLLLEEAADGLGLLPRRVVESAVDRDGPGARRGLGHRARVARRGHGAPPSRCRGRNLSVHRRLRPQQRRRRGERGEEGKRASHGRTRG